MTDKDTMLPTGNIQGVNSGCATEPVAGEIREIPGVIRQYWYDGRWHDMFFRAIDEKRRPLAVTNQAHHAATWEHQLYSVNVGGKLYP